jgi:hypothetical protein
MVASDPVIPNCCEGFAWVRILGMTPDYGNRNQKCVPPIWKMVVELGISRCAPPVCGDGMQNPCCENEADAVNVQLGDYAAMVRTLGCCLLPRIRQEDSCFGGDQILAGPWAVDEPSGGCVSSRMQATITIFGECGC